MTPQAKNNNDNEPATKNFVRQSIDELAEAVKVGFDNTATKEDVSVIKKDLSGLKKDVSGLKKDVSGLKKDVSGLKKDVSGLKKDVSGLKNGQDSLKENQERILSIVESIDQHFKEHRDLPRKVERLEVDVFKLQTRPR